MSKAEIKQMVKDIWTSGVYAYIEIDRNWDPLDIKEGIEETFEEYWEEHGEKINYKIVQE